MASPIALSVAIEKAKGIAINAVPGFFAPDPPPQIIPKPPLPMFVVPGTPNPGAAVLAASVNQRGSVNSGNDDRKAPSPGNPGTDSSRGDQGPTNVGKGGDGNTADPNKEPLPPEKLDDLRDLASKSEDLVKSLKGVDQLEKERLLTPGQAEKAREVIREELLKLKEQEADVFSRYDMSGAYEDDGETLKIKPGAMCEEPTVIRSPKLDEEEGRELLKGSVMSPEAQKEKEMRESGIIEPDYLIEDLFFKYSKLPLPKRIPDPIIKGIQKAAEEISKATYHELNEMSISVDIEGSSSYDGRPRHAPDAIDALNESRLKRGLPPVER